MNELGNKTVTERTLTLSAMAAICKGVEPLASLEKTVDGPRAFRRTSRLHVSR